MTKGREHYPPPCSRHLGQVVYVYLGGALAARHNVVERRARVTASIPVLMHTYSNTPSPASCVRSVLAGGGGGERGQLQLGSLLTRLVRGSNFSGGTLGDLEIPAPFPLISPLSAPWLLSLVLPSSR